MANRKKEPGAQTYFIAWLTEAYQYYVWLYDINRRPKQSFALFLGMKPGLICDFLTGRAVPTREEVRVLAQAFGPSVYNTIDPDVLFTLKPARKSRISGATPIKPGGVSAILDLIEYPSSYALRSLSPDSNKTPANQPSPETLPISDVQSQKVLSDLPVEIIVPSAVQEDLPVGQVHDAPLPPCNNFEDPLPAGPVEYPDFVLKCWSNYLRLTSVTYGWVKKFSLHLSLSYPDIVSAVNALHAKASSLSIRIAGIPFSQELYALSVECERDVQYVCSPEADTEGIYAALDRLERFVSEAEARLDYAFCLNPV